MKHLQTLVVVMMTAMMVFAAPLSSPDRANRTIDENNLLKEQIHRKAEMMLAHVPVRNPGGSRRIVSFFSTRDANNLHFAGRGAG